MNHVAFSAPTFRWLFGGLGFHNSEASMTRLMPLDFRNERVVKTFRGASRRTSRPRNAPNSPRPLRPVWTR